MNDAAKYAKIVLWSEEDNCFVGICPDLFYGGCHGDDEKAVFAELCEIVEENIEIYRQDGTPLPRPTKMEELEELMATAAAKRSDLASAQIAQESIGK